MSTHEYRTYRNAAANAARVGNHSAALAFASQASECDWVFPREWHPGTSFGTGPELPGAELGDTATWRTRHEAEVAAKAIGWPVGDSAIGMVFNRIHGIRWALVDGRFGFVSRTWYARMSAARSVA